MRKQGLFTAYMLRIMTVVCLLGMAQLLVMTQAWAGEKTVRIGYYENGPFQNGAGEGLVKSGYSYEYMQHLQMFTNWQYEYVYGDYGALYQKLLAGDIDILTGIAYRPDREGLIAYPKRTMGMTPYMFLKRSADKRISSDPKTIAGKRIGALEGAMMTVVEKYLVLNHIEAQVIPFVEMKDRDSALASGAVDIIIVEALGTDEMDGIEAFAEAGTTEYYACVNVQRPDILDDLNRAQEELLRETPKLKERLHDNWYRETPATTILTERDHAWIDTHQSLKVGYYKNFLPYCATDENGNVTGLLKDVVPEIFRKLKVQDMYVTYKGYDSIEDMEKALREKEIDVMFPAYSEYWAAEQDGLLPSNGVIQSVFNAVYRGEFPDMDSARIAVVERNPLAHAHMMVRFPNNELVYCKSAEACLDAVVEGRADMTIINGMRADYLLRSKSSYRVLSSAPLPQNTWLGFAALKSSADTINVLNHGIAMLAPDFALTHAYPYEEKHKVTVTEFLQDNMWVGVFFAFLIFALAMRELRKKSELVHLKERQRVEMERKVEEISDLNNDLQEKQAQLEEAAEEQQAQIEQITKLNQSLHEHQAELVAASEEQLAQIEQITRLNQSLHENQAELEQVTKAKQEKIEEITLLNDTLQEQREELSVAKEAAEASDRAKTAFLFNMSHDIRTPMNAIIGFTNIIDKNIDDKERVRDYLQKVKSANEFLLSLINNVLEMARIESGKAEVDETHANVREFVKVVSSVFEEQMKEKRLSFRCTVDVEHDEIMADTTKMREIFLNLISNAVKYTQEGGSVSLSVTEEASEREGWTVIRSVVSDTGIGMPAEFLPKLFEPFTREKTTTQSGIQGTGLGMVIVKELVELMHGTIEVTSELGQGTRFELHIPHRISKTKVVTGIEKAQERNYEQFKGMRILMAEDNELNAEIGMFVLGEKGFIVEHAENGVDCVDMLVHSEPGYYDFILMDVQMPEMDGYQATRTIRAMKDKRRANIPIIAMTANAFDEDRRKALLMGMNAHVTKPVDVEILYDTIQNVLEHKDHYVHNDALEAFREMYQERGCTCGFFSYRADEAEEILYVDQGTMTIFGCDTKEDFLELVDGSFKHIVHSDDLASVEEQINTQQSVEGNDLDYVDYNIVRRNGSIRRVADIGCKVFNGEEVVYYVYIADITELEGNHVKG